MNRRDFIGAAALGAVMAGTAPPISGSSAFAAETSNNPNPVKKMNIVVAADPFAVVLKDAIVAHLKEKGHTVEDVGSLAGKDSAYYDCIPIAAKRLQEKKAERAVLFCGTGMGAAIVANRFPGVVAAVVESVFAARMSRTINNANALCLGGMIWGEWMAKEAVDVFLKTEFTEGLPQFCDFLKAAEKKVDAIRP
ncbi:MAG: RpiB/LacA/LacB family sugar-phosphate isomerase [Planctomycetaceae bacterium]|nr:RpiB/LacA/LacB family sugar-phosphate isomerase [Planctomycetaceae bacterium]